MFSKQDADDLVAVEAYPLQRLIGKLSMLMVLKKLTKNLTSDT